MDPMSAAKRQEALSAELHAAEKKPDLMTAATMLIFDAKPRTDEGDTAGSCHAWMSGTLSVNRDTQIRMATNCQIDALTFEQRPDTNHNQSWLTC